MPVTDHTPNDPEHSIPCDSSDDLELFDWFVQRSSRASAAESRMPFQRYWTG